MRTMLKSHRSLTARSCNGQSDGTKEQLDAGLDVGGEQVAQRPDPERLDRLRGDPLAPGGGPRAEEHGGLELVGEHCRHPHPRQPAELDPVHPWHGGAEGARNVLTSSGLRGHTVDARAVRRNQ